jgi:hypothetical protein
MRRKLVTLASGVSLLACLATVVVWARGRFRAEFFGAEQRYATGSLSVYERSGLWNGSGRVFVGSDRARSSNPPNVKAMSRIPAVHRRWHRSLNDAAPFPRGSGLFLGIVNEVVVVSPGARETRRGITIPHWCLVTALLLLPGAALIRHFRRRRAHQVGFCRRCGYDLRASPDQCPECGTPAQSR